MRGVRATILVLLTLVAVVPAQEPTKDDLLRAIEKQLKAANETAGPSVACVVVSKSDRYPKLAPATEQSGKLGGFDKAEFLKAHPTEKQLASSLDLTDSKTIADHGYAGGVVVDATGLILTPYHVVEGASKVYVHLPGRVGSYADIHAADSRHDLAVLKLINPPAGMTAIKYADVRLDTRVREKPTIFRGKLTVLLTNPYVTGFPIDKPSAGLGSVTGIRLPEKSKVASQSYYLYGTFIEHDAKLNAGVDGAALLNLDGELIGLATSSALVTGGERGVNYAFPTDLYFRRVVDALCRGEEVDYGYLGVRGPTEVQNGMIFSSVMPLGPAAQAGMVQNDMLTHVDGLPTTSYEELLLKVGSALAGSKVKLTLSRNGRAREVEVLLGKFKHGQPYIASVRPEPVFGLHIDYGSIRTQSLPDSVKQQSIPASVSIRELVANSPAAAAFKKLGDNHERWLITHVNGNAVNTPAEFHKAAKGQTSLKLTVRDPGENDPRDREVTLP